MTNLPQTCRNLVFKGPDWEDIIKGHFDVVWSINKLAMAMPHAKFTAHVSPRLEPNPLEWTLVVVSPQGRHTYEIVQTSPNSPTLLDRRTL